MELVFLSEIYNQYLKDTSKLGYQGKIQAAEDHGLT